MFMNVVYNEVAVPVTRKEQAGWDGWQSMRRQILWKPYPTSYRNTSINYLNRKVCCRETHSRISRWGGEDFSNEVQEDKPERDIWSHVTVCEF